MMGAFQILQQQLATLTSHLLPRGSTSSFSSPSMPSLASHHFSNLGQRHLITLSFNPNSCSDSIDSCPDGFGSSLKSSCSGSISCPRTTVSILRPIIILGPYLLTSLNGNGLTLGHLLGVQQLPPTVILGWDSTYIGVPHIRRPRVGDVGPSSHCLRVAISTATEPGISSIDSLASVFINARLIFLAQWIFNLRRPLSWNLQMEMVPPCFRVSNVLIFSPNTNPHAM